MKKAILRFFLSFVICHSSFVISKAQWVSIPDTNFGTWLNTNGYSACMQGNNSVGWQMDTTCPAVVGAGILDCSFVSVITDLTGISYFDNLQHLNCSYNQINNLPVLPSGLGILYCYGNRLNSLPDLPGGLIELDCTYNQLTSLPVFPTGLARLWCSHNQLSSLPDLPAELSWLNCGYNQLGVLPDLPDSLNALVCEHNLLTSLPQLPKTLTGLTCNNNQLSSLPDLPDTLGYSYINNNPLSCLPLLKYIGYLKFDFTNIICLPNYGNVTTSTPLLNTFPLCDSLIPNPCAVITEIQSTTTNPQFAISPNPATTSVTITVDARLTDKVGQETLLNSTATITDLTGRKMTTVQLSTYNSTLTTSAFSSGIYLLTLTTPEGSSATKKLVISK